MACPLRSLKSISLSWNAWQRRQKRQQLLIHTWRTVALLSLSTALGWLLLRYGWSLNGPHQVVVRGDTTITPELLSEMSELRFLAFLAINPTWNKGCATTFLSSQSR